MCTQCDAGGPALVAVISRREGISTSVSKWSATPAACSLRLGPHLSHVGLRCLRYMLRAPLHRARPPPARLHTKTRQQQLAVAGTPRTTQLRAKRPAAHLGQIRQTVQAQPVRGRLGVVLEDVLEVGQPDGEALGHLAHVVPVRLAMLLQPSGEVLLGAACVTGAVRFSVRTSCVEGVFTGEFLQAGFMPTCKRQGHHTCRYKSGRLPPTSTKQGPHLAFAAVSSVWCSSREGVDRAKAVPHSRDTHRRVAIFIMCKRICKLIVAVPRIRREIQMGSQIRNRTRPAS